MSMEACRAARPGCLIVCESKKAGMAEHLEAIRASLAASTAAAAVSRSPQVSMATWFADVLRRLRAGRGLAVFFSIGPASVALMLYARLAGWLTVYYCHEPGGWGYLRLRNGRIRSALILALNAGLTWGCHKALVGSPYARRPFGRKAIFCPLPYRGVDGSAAAGTATGAGAQPAVGMLGTISGERGIRELATLASRFDVVVLSNRPLPAFAAQHARVLSDREFSRDDKQRFLGGVSCVVNVRRDPYNQSGVTAECLIHGVPVVTSTHDPYVRRYLSTLLPQVEAGRDDEGELLAAVDQAARIGAEGRRRIKTVGSAVFVDNPARLFRRLVHFSRKYS